ncbi:virion associated protein [Banana streak UA virus]|uniref:Virion associated protein n=1 Tax=Banana streak UA virus TaxID=1016854 RepID=F5AY17_9VIRU|nr:virion associated protein [Banana streak UA virus]AEC49873.1 virion associated protein [Banana streak UA virus]
MTSSNSQYQQALTNTKTTFGSDSVGFVTENPSQTSTAKQLNTTIQLLIQLHEALTQVKIQVKDIQDRVRAIEGRSGESSAGTPAIKSDIEAINQKLQKIQNIQATRPKSEQGTSKVKVFQDPYNLLRRL